MALFKQLRGSRASLNTQPLHDGYAYFCVDDGTFHIDYADDNGVLHRKQINAKDAETLGTHTADEFLLEADLDAVLAQAKASGEFDGADGISATHVWNGTTLTITSAAGTSSANLKGDAGYSPVRGTDYWTAADKAEIKSYVDDAIANADITGGGGGIIDVLELPTEDINEQSIYRLTYGALYYGGQVQGTTYVVDELPTIGEPCITTGQDIGVAYYNIADYTLYGYVSDEIGSVLGVSVGWYPAVTLMQALGFAYNGVVASINDMVENEAFYLLLGHSYHACKDGNWIKFSIDTTDNNVEFYIAGISDTPMTLTDVLLSDGINCIFYTQIVETLPSNLKISDLESGVVYLYIVESTGIAYGDLGEGVATLGNGIFHADGFDKGWSTDINSETELGIYCVRKNGDKGTIKLDTTLTKSGRAADAKAVGDAVTTIEGNIAEIDNKKVNKVNGKGLSTNDFTNEYKNKLDSLMATYSEGLEYTILSDTECSLAGIGSCTDTDIVVPSMIIGRSVTNIGNSAFWDCTSLTSVTIPDSVTSIGDYAFDGCSSLTSITIPDSVTSIGHSAFRNCTSLKKVVLPNNLTEIKSQLFYMCESLEDITLPEGIISIGTSAFKKNAFTSINLPESLTNIGSNVFSECTMLRDIYLPSGVSTIKSFTFDECTSLTKIVIPSTVQSIENCAFYNCTGLISVTIPDSTTIINGIFDGCTAIEEYMGPYVKIPSLNLRHVKFTSGTDVGSFNGCSNLETIVLPQNLSTIGGNTFNRCSNLRNIIIPSSVTTIGSQAFFNCASLTHVTFEDSSSLTSLGAAAFAKCKSLTSIVLPSRLKTIGANVFYECTSLQSAVIETTTIPMGTFNGCSSLQSVVLSAYLESIGDDAFAECNNLQRIHISNEVTTFGERAFDRCNSLTSITIPEKLTTIPSSYSYLYALEEINFNATNMEDSTANSNHFFMAGYLSNGITVNIGENVTRIPAYMFYDHKFGSKDPGKYVEVNFADGCVCDTIASHAFYDCTRLKSIKIPSTVTTIEANAFLGCSQITIYCEAESQPEGWDANWNPDNRPVVWGAASDVPSLNTKIDTLETDLKAYIDETFLGGEW